MLQCLGGFNEYPIKLIGDTPVRFVSQLFILMGMVLQGPTPRAQDGVEGGDWCGGCGSGGGVYRERRRRPSQGGGGGVTKLRFVFKFSTSIVR